LFHGIPINLDMIGWYEAMAKGISSGAIITTDYGFKCSKDHAKFDYPNFRTFQRHIDPGTFSNPLERVGKKDMTSDINFAILQKLGYKHTLSDLFLGEQDDVLNHFSGLSTDDSSFLTLIQGRNLPKLYI